MTDAHFKGLASAIDRADLLEDPRFATLKSRVTHMDELDAVISEWTARHTKAELVRAHEPLSRAMCAGARARRSRQRSAYARTRSTTARRASRSRRGRPSHGGNALRRCGNARTSHRARQSGADNATVFRDWLGLSTERIRSAGRGRRGVSAATRSHYEADDMNFDYTDDQKAIREGVRAVASRFDDRYWLARDDDGKFPLEFHRAMAEGGWLGITMPTGVRRIRHGRHRSRDHDERSRAAWRWHGCGFDRAHQSVRAASDHRLRNRRAEAAVDAAARLRRRSVLLRCNRTGCRPRHHAYSNLCE